MDTDNSEVTFGGEGCKEAKWQWKKYNKNHFICFYILKKWYSFTLAFVAQLVGVSSCKPKGHRVLCPVRAHTWVAGSVPSWVYARGNPPMFLSYIAVPLPLLLTFPLSIINKHVLGWGEKK